MPRFKSIIFFYQNNLKIKLFLQKIANFSSIEGGALWPSCLRRLGALPSDLPPPSAAGGSAFRPPKQTPTQCEFLATRLSTKPWYPDENLDCFQSGMARDVNYRMLKTIRVVVKKSAYWEIKTSFQSWAFLLFQQSKLQKMILCCLITLQVFCRSDLTGNAR